MSSKLKSISSGEGELCVESGSEELSQNISRNRRYRVKKLLHLCTENKITNPNDFDSRGISRLFNDQKDLVGRLRVLRGEL